MGEIVNLRRARKAKARAAADQKAAANRTLHGQSRAARDAAAAEQALEARRHAAHRRDRAAEPGDDV